MIRLFLALLLAAGAATAGGPSFAAETPATSAGAAQSQGQAPAAPAVNPPERQRRPQPLDEVGAIFEQRGVLTPKGSLILEPSFQYSHSSSNRVALLGYTIIPALTIGLIDVRDVNSDTLIGALAVRYGITNRLELEFKIPYVYRNDSSSVSALNTPTASQVFSATGHGFGDEEATLRYQINQPPGPGAIYIGSLRVKLRTGKDPFEVPVDNAASAPGQLGIPTVLPVGSGFYAIQPAITWIFPSDPAVLFGSLNYQWNIQRDIAGVGTIDPGDALGINFGMGIGLNERLSFSLGYDHSVLGSNTRDGQRLGDSKTTQVGTMLFGATYRLSDRTNLNLSLGIGVTSASPDVQFAVKLPTSAF